MPPKATHANRDRAEAQLSKACTAEGNTALTAPRAGTVTTRAAVPGQVVNPWQKVVAIVANAGLEALLGEKVILFSPLVDTNTASVIVKARVDSEMPGTVVVGTPVIRRLTIPQAPSITLP